MDRPSELAPPVLMKSANRMNKSALPALQHSPSGTNNTSSSVGSPNHPSPNSLGSPNHPRGAVLSGSLGESMGEVTLGGSFAGEVAQLSPARSDSGAMVGSPALARRRRQNAGGVNGGVSPENSDSSPPSAPPGRVGTSPRSDREGTSPLSPGLDGRRPNRKPNDGSTPTALLDILDPDTDGTQVVIADSATLANCQPPRTGIELGSRPTALAPLPTHALSPSARAALSRSGSSQDGLM